jgi:hypothetical protein
MTADQKKKPTAGFWITVVLLALLVAYPLSIGPALWYSIRHAPANVRILTAYRPLAWMIQESPAPVRRFIAKNVISPMLRESGRNLMMRGDGIFFVE